MRGDQRDSCRRMAREGVWGGRIDCDFGEFERRDERNWMSGVGALGRRYLRGEVPG